MLETSLLQGSSIQAAIKSEMDINIELKDFNRTHQIDAKAENKGQSIIVKFTRYSKRRKVFNSEKRLRTFPLLGA